MTRVFVASSGDLADERKELKEFLHDEEFKPVLWEDSDKSITTQEYQKRLNEDYLYNSDIVIFMIKNRYGKYTREEFNFSYSKLDKGIERIFVYFFPQDITKMSYEDIEHIKKLQDFLEEDGKIYNTVQDINELKLAFSKQEKYWDSPKIVEYSDEERVLEDTQEHYIIPDEIKQLKELLNQANPLHFQAMTYAFLPIQSFGRLPSSANEIVEYLYRLGKEDDNSIPLLCLLKKLYNDKPHEAIKKSMDFLISEYHKSKINYLCQENKAISEFTMLIEFLPEDGKEHTVKVWGYSNKESYQIPIEDDTAQSIDSVNLYDKDSISNFMEHIHAYTKKLEELYHSNIYVDIILPNQELIKQDIKNFKALDYATIRKFKTVLRLQSRFNKPDDRWKMNWEALNRRDNTLNIAKEIKGNTYNKELSNANKCIILHHKIDNEKDQLLKDIKEFGIPIVVSSFQTNKIDSLSRLKNITIKESQDTICTEMMDNHNDDNINIFFIYDNPEKIPDEYKNHEENLFSFY